MSSHNMNATSIDHFCRDDDDIDHSLRRQEVNHRWLDSTATSRAHPHRPDPLRLAAVATVMNVEVEELRKNYCQIPFRKNEIVMNQAYPLFNHLFDSIFIVYIHFSY